MSLNVSLQSDSLNFNLDAIPLSKIYLDVDNNLTLETNNEINYYSDSNIISITNEPFEVNSLMTLNIDSDGNQSLNFKTKNPKNYWGRIYLQDFIQADNVPENKKWLKIAWSPELSLFCAVSDSNSGTWNGMYSADGGLTWAYSEIDIQNWFSITWSPEVGVFLSGSSGNGSNQNQIARSSDGINWSYYTIAGGRSYRHVIWVNYLQLFIAFSDVSGANGIETSPDGITWTNRTAPDGLWSAYSYSDELGIVVVVSNDNSTGAYSYDGITWNSITTPISTWRGVTYSPELNLFVACSVVGTPMMTSRDGIVWTTVPLTLQNSWRSIDWISDLGLFVSIGNNSGVSEKFIYSSDGINWTLKDQSGMITSRPFDFAWSPEYKRIVAISDIASLDQIIRTTL